MYNEYQNLHIVCKIGFGFPKSDLEHKNLLQVLEIVVQFALSCLFSQNQNQYVHMEFNLQTEKNLHRRPGLGPFKLTPNSSSLNFVFMIEFVYETKFRSIVELTPNSSSLIFVRSSFVVNGVTYRRIRQFSENVIWVPRM